MSKRRITIGTHDGECGADCDKHAVPTEFVDAESYDQLVALLTSVRFQSDDGDTHYCIGCGTANGSPDQWSCPPHCPIQAALKEHTDAVLAGPPSKD